MTIDQTRPARRSRRKAAAPAQVAPVAAPACSLPAPFAAWFASRGWSPRAHQLALLAKAEARRDTLLIAPTGAGKTLAGFLPSLVDLHTRGPKRETRGSGLHTLYISPLKALAVDVARNLTAPITEMDLTLTAETRTGDTSAAKKSRQRTRPPDMLLTTPEQIALLISHEDAHYLFADLEILILDELHALAPSKRGDLLALGIARLRTLAPRLMTIGLSATVARPTESRAYLSAQRSPETEASLADVVVATGGAQPKLSILETEGELPWAGHTTRYAIPEIYQAVKAHRLSLLFVNTRSQAELVFQELWRINDDTLPIGLHHGSLDATQRRKVEAAMAAGRLRAVVCTSTLDLGIDWGDVDLVVNIGAPKGASRLIQRIGRANHRLDEPSVALLVPSNRFEVLECRAALDAAEAGAQDAIINRTGTLDVLAQHVFGVAASAPFAPDQLFDEVRSAQPYAGLTRGQFDRIIDFVSTGGYALRAYERYARLRPTVDGRLRISHPRLAQQHRMNVGTIVDAPMLKVRLVGKRGPPSRGTPQRLAGGRVLGEIDESFIGELSYGDTFLFAGEVVRFEGLRETEAYVSRSASADPKIPIYSGGKFPLSTHLAARVRAMLADPAYWQKLPGPVSQWLELQLRRSILPTAEEVLVETFPRNGRSYLVVYPFEGRLAHQTLGMLLTRRLDRGRARPLGFVASDYGLAIWCASDLGEMFGDGRLSLGDLFDEDMLGDDLEAWLDSSSMMKRTFRMCAVIAGLIERRHPGKEKTGRQMTVSSDLIYDVLRNHDPGHILLEAARADAATGLLDIARLGDFLIRIKGHIRYQSLARVSPLSVPILLEMGKEPVKGQAAEGFLRDAALSLIEDVMMEAGGQ